MNSYVLVDNNIRVDKTPTFSSYSMAAVTTSQLTIPPLIGTYAFLPRSVVD